MKRALLPAIVLVVALVVGAIVWLSRDPDTSSGSVANDRRARTGADALGSDPIDANDDVLSGADQAARAERELLASSAARAAGPTLNGEILPPPDCALDDSVEVFALSRESDLDGLFAAIGPRRPDDQNTDAARIVLARAKPDANGHFRLTLPAGTRKTHVLFAGRSWFLRDSLAVSVKEGVAAGVALQAECGGWIAGRIDLPAAALSRATELDGAIAVVRPAVAGGFAGGPRGGFRRSERRALVDDLAFEVRALDPAGAYTLELVPASFAAVQTEVQDVARGRATPLTVSMSSGGTITGRAVGAGGEAVAGARIEVRVQGQLFGFDDRLVRTGESRSDGTFDLGAVAPGTVQVSAQAQNLVASDATKVDVMEGSARSGVELVLGAGETIAGVVTWKDGRPAAGAEISVDVERGGRNFGPQMMRGAGRRADDPLPIADEQGRFVVNGLRAGTYAVTAEQLTPEDAVAATQANRETKRKLAWRGRTTGVKTGQRDVALVLEAPVNVRGTVKQADGAPVTEFAVQAQPGGRGQNGPGGGPFVMGAEGPNGNRNVQSFTDAQGAFVMSGLREGTWRLDVTADGFAPTESIEVTLPMKAGDPEPAFVLQRAAVINGLVTSPGGAPVAGASITQVTSGGGANWMRGGNDAGVLARSDARGRFRVEGQKAGRIALVAESKDWARSDEVAVDLTAGQSLDGVVLLVHAGGRVTGELYEDGRAAAGRTLNATHTALFLNVSARSDSGGRFVFEHMAAGAWRIVSIPTSSALDAEGGQGRGMFGGMKTTTVDVVDGQETHVVIGATPSEPVAVRGRVTQAGEGVPDARVIFMQQGRAPGEGTKNATCKADGAYSVLLDAPGAYTVAVNVPQSRMGMIEFDTQVGAGGDVVVDLPLPTARLSGRVRSPSGDPAANVRVTLLSGAQSVGGTMAGGFNDMVTDAQGAFDITLLRAGEYQLAFGGSRATRPGPASDAPYGRKIVSGIQLAEGEWKRDLEVRLEKSGSVQVEIVDERAEPVAGAAVFARDAEGRPVERLTAVRSDAAGKTTYTGLAPGRYTFSAHKGKLAAADSHAIEVSSDGVGNVRVTLAAGTMLIVTTVDDKGAPMRAPVSVTDEEGRDVAGLMSYQELGERFSRSGPGGNEQRIGPLPAGKYRVRATTTAGAAAEKSVTLSGQDESRITLALES